MVQYLSFAFGIVCLCSSIDGMYCVPASMACIVFQHRWHVCMCECMFVCADDDCVLFLFSRCWNTRFVFMFGILWSNTTGGEFDK